MLDETILTETPPLYACYGRIGGQVRGPITGDRGKRILHGALTVWSGDVLLSITDEGDQYTHQYFLRRIRAHWRGWRLALFADRGAPHLAAASLELARAPEIEVRFLPKATPAPNAMDQPRRRVKGRAVASRATRSIGESAVEACQYILALRPHERLRQAGVLSGNFWLTS